MFILDRLEKTGEKMVFGRRLRRFDTRSGEKKNWMKEWEPVPAGTIVACGNADGLTLTARITMSEEDFRKARFPDPELVGLGGGDNLNGFVFTLPRVRRIDSRTTSTEPEANAVAYRLYTLIGNKTATFELPPNTLYNYPLSNVTEIHKPNCP
jgi:hypothetical protein